MPADLIREDKGSGQTDWWVKCTECPHLPPFGPTTYVGAQSLRDAHDHQHHVHRPTQPSWKADTTCVLCHDTWPCAGAAKAALERHQGGYGDDVLAWALDDGPDRDVQEPEP